MASSSDPRELTPEQTAQMEKDCRVVTDDSPPRTAFRWGWADGLVAGRASSPAPDPARMFAIAATEWVQGEWCDCPAMGIAELDEHASLCVWREGIEAIKRSLVAAVASSPVPAEHVETAHRVFEKDGEVIVEPPITAGITIYLDRHPFSISGVAIVSEHELRNLPMPTVPDDFEIWLEQPNEDVRVERSVSLRGGERFYITPKNISGGARVSVGDEDGDSHWATVVINPDSFEPREASPVELELLSEVGVDVDRMWIQPGEKKWVVTVASEDTRERAILAAVDALPPSAHVNRARAEVLTDAVLAVVSPSPEDTDDLFGVNVDASLDGALRGILDQFTHEDYCPTQTGQGPGVCTCGWGIAQDVIRALVQQLRVLDRKAGAVAMRPLSDWSAEQLDRWAAQAEADMTGAAAPPVGVDEREWVIGTALRNGIHRHPTVEGSAWPPVDEPVIVVPKSRLASSAAPGVTEAMREALSFYADRVNYFMHDDPGDTRAPVAKDKGEKARAALAVSPARYPSVFKPGSREAVEAMSPAPMPDWRCPDCGSGITKIHATTDGLQGCGKPPGYWSRGVSPAPTEGPDDA